MIIKNWGVLLIDLRKSITHVGKAYILNDRDH